MSGPWARPAAVAGSFYPAGAAELEAVVERALADAPAAGPGDRRPEALIVPHAGYVYSGPVAAAAYARLRRWREGIERVVLLGPAHRVPVRSMAVSSADRWDTPLGPVPIDAELRARILALPGVVVDDDAHAPEHSIEVELPFLQRALDPTPFSLLPIVVGHASAEDVAAVLQAVWSGDETVVVISSDLSHYESYDRAAAHDRRTADAIVAGRLQEIAPQDACGAFPLRGLLTAARTRQLDIELVDLRNSGDTAGPSDRVVGYGAFVLSASSRAEPPADEVEAGDRPDDADRTVTEAPGPPGQPVSTAPAPGGAHAITGRADWVLARSGDTLPPPAPPLSEPDQDLVLDTALGAIRARLEGREAAPRSPDTPAHLLDPGATFVTLRDGKRLLGCIGSVEARRPLLDDVADNAVGAAFHDPRMPALTPFEFGRMNLHVSVLSALVRLDVRGRAELLDRLTPGLDGLLIEAGRHRGTFLPSVWRQLPDPPDFVDQLWRKAGLTPRDWPANLRVWRYGVTEFGEAGPRPAIDSAAALTRPGDGPERSPSGAENPD